MSSTKNPGRFAGLLYVLTSIVGFFAMVYVPTKLIVHGNAAATASDNSGKVFSGGGCPAELHLLDRDGRRLLRESGIPLGPVGPILLSPAGGTKRHGLRSVPRAASAAARSTFACSSGERCTSIIS